MGKAADSQHEKTLLDPQDMNLTMFMFNGENGFIEPTPIQWGLRLALVWFILSMDLNYVDLKKWSLQMFHPIDPILAPI